MIAVSPEAFELDPRGGRRVPCRTTRGCSVGVVRAVRVTVEVFAFGSSSPSKTPSAMIRTIAMTRPIAPKMIIVPICELRWTSSLAGDALVERVEGLVDLGRLGRDLGQLVAGHGAQRTRHGARPGASVGGVLEVLAGRGAPRRGLLAEQVVGDLVAAVVADVGAGRADRPDGFVRARLDRARARLQQRGDLVVGLALLEQELQRGALEVGEAVEAGHDAATLATAERPGHGEPENSVRVRR